MSTTVVIIKQEVINLGPLIAQLNRSNTKAIILDGNNIKDAILELPGGTVEAVDFFRQTIKSNKIQCTHCNTVIESLFTYHTVYCNCGDCKITGGKTTLTRDVKGYYRELSTYYVQK